MKLPSYADTTKKQEDGSPPSPKPPPFSGKFATSASILAYLKDDPYNSDENPYMSDSDVSSIASYDTDYMATKKGDFLPVESPKRAPLKWEFKGLTLWLEFEEFDDDLTQAIEFNSNKFGTGKIPVAHATAIYGMTHLSRKQAIKKLDQFANIMPQWPGMDAASGVRCDISQEGLPGQVCTVAWSEISFSSNPSHEAALDELYSHFEVPSKRQSPWTPHVSLAYDNPENTVLSLHGTYASVKQYPSLLRSRGVKAISLWDTQGKMAEWKCLHRVHFQMNLKE